MKIVKSQLLTRVSDVVDSTSEGNSLASKLLSWSDLAIPLDIFGDREGGVKFVGVWFGVLGLPELLDVSGPEFIVLLCSHTRRVNRDFEHG